MSLLTAFSKVFEKLIYTRLYTHLLDNNILNAHQFGFRAHHSTEKATFSLINSILEAMNQNLMIGGIFCDLKKAFDSINHEIIFEKIQFYGIIGKFKMLIQSYFNSRYQKVTWNNNSSAWEKINCGVPQGSILGPLLFLINMNDLPSIINNNNNNRMVLYADNTSVIITDSNPIDFNLQANLLFHNINTWFKNNLLLLNLNKTQYLEFQTKQYGKIKGQIQYNNSHLTNDTHVKFLGLIIDSTLTWNQHIDLVTRRLSSACYALNCLKYSLPSDTLKIIYFAHVQSME